MMNSKKIINQRCMLARKSCKDQYGVVLISCIIFLLLILLLLKISLSSARVSEQKSGIDYEIMTAQESAQLALRAAESKILSVVRQGDLSICQGTGADSSECQASLKAAIELAWIMASANVATDSSSSTEVISCSSSCDSWGVGLKERVNGAYANFNAADKQIILAAVNKIKAQKGIFYGNGSCGSDPQWYCVKWSTGKEGEEYFVKKKNASLDSIEANDIRKLGKRYDVAPRYIIERFLPGEADMPGDASILFRVTAVGFGQSGGSDENVTHAIFQSNYVL